jgi:hypothetical protein
VELQALQVLLPLPWFGGGIVPFCSFAALIASTMLSITIGRTFNSGAFSFRHGDGGLFIYFSAPGARIFMSFCALSSPF